MLALAELSLRNASGQPLRFVPQDQLPEGRAYEEFIGATGCVPTRDNLHDFFNALVWLTFPRIKQQLNALQSAQIALAGVGKSRGPARDAATIFDENSALLVVRDSDEGRALVDALRGHRWQEAFCQRRAAFGRDAQVWLFGHALMEKLVAPRKAITAHTRVIVADDGYFALAPRCPARVDRRARGAGAGRRAAFHRRLYAAAGTRVAGMVAAAGRRFLCRHQRVSAEERNMMQTVRWGILGTGKIARAFAEALKDTPGAVLAGVASRSADSAQAFAREFGAAAGYGSYQALADAGDIDIVYIGTPHPMHAENALMALNAGKGVLCEKAFTMNRREAEAVVALARAKKLFLMEAMWTRFMPALAEVRRIIASGEIGQVHQITADFGFTATQGPEHRVFNPEPRRRRAARSRESIRCRSPLRCLGRWLQCARKRKWAPPASTSLPDSR